MEKQTNAAFIVDRENSTITIKRKFAAGRSLVWDAFTKSEILDQWWAPEPWQARTKIMDFREGGGWLYVMEGPEGEEHWSCTDFETIIPEQKYVGSDAFTDAEGRIIEDLPQSKWDLSFSDDEGSTQVTLHISYQDTEQLDATLQMGFREGITMTMDSLDGLLERLQKN